MKLTKPLPIHSVLLDCLDHDPTTLQRAALVALCDGEPRNLILRGHSPGTVNSLRRAGWIVADQCAGHIDHSVVTITLGGLAAIEATQ